MKKAFIITICAICAFLFASCSKSYKDFVGTWGVEKIEYYNIDYAGNPISETVNTLDYDPENIDNGIQLIFRSDKTGEMHDNDVDTVWYMVNDTLQEYVVNPDTTLVTKFTYSYDDKADILYMTMDYVYTYRMSITDLTSNSFTYENEYKENYVEKAYLKRLSNSPSKADSKATMKRKPARPVKPESFLSGKH